MLLTLEGLKNLVQDKEGIPPEDQNLFFSSRLLGPDTATLAELMLSDGDVIRLELKRRGLRG